MFFHYLYIVNKTLRNIKKVRAMVTIKCNNSERKSVKFSLNGGQKDEIMVTAIQDGEYWFSIGNGRIYKTTSGAKKAAVKEMAQLGYTFDENEMKNLEIC